MSWIYISELHKPSVREQMNGVELATCLIQNPANSNEPMVVDLRDDIEGGQIGSNNRLCDRLGMVKPSVLGSNGAAREVKQKFFVADNREQFAKVCRSLKFHLSVE